MVISFVPLIASFLATRRLPFKSIEEKESGKQDEPREIGKIHSAIHGYFLASNFIVSASMESQIQQPKSIATLFGNYEIKKQSRPTSERSDLIQQISNVTGIEFKLLLRETFHLKDDWGNRILQIILDDTLRYSTEKSWRRWKCAELVGNSKAKKVSKLSTP